MMFELDDLKYVLEAALADEASRERRVKQALLIVDALAVYERASKGRDECPKSSASP